jgi:hypothetical protein
MFRWGTLAKKGGVSKKRHSSNFWNPLHVYRRQVHNNEGQLPLEEIFETAVRRVRCSSEISDSQQGHEAVRTKTERSAELEAVTRQPLVKIQQIEVT